MLTACNLKVEYKSNPIGMDEKSPRFSYELDGTGKDQTAYRITVQSEQGETVWDSGFTESNLCNQIVYGGKPLECFTRYNWQVQVKDEKGKISKGGEEKAFFETGFLGTAWQGKWIFARGGTAYKLPPQKLFRPFEVTGKLKAARLYTAALGLYEAYINGQTVTEDIFTPGWTDYYKRVQYQAYDVTKLIKPGKNTAATLLGDGWFCGSIVRLWSQGNPTYGPHPMLCQELHLIYEDGRREVIASDGNYKSYTPTNPDIRLSDIYAGELYDAAAADDSWKMPDMKHYAGNASVFEGWAETAYFESMIPHFRSWKLPQIVWQSGAPVRRIMTVKPVSVRKRKETGTFIVDFGQNLTGRERLTLKNTKKGMMLTIRHGEMLDADGSLYTENLRGAEATTTYYAATNPKKTVYEPKFTFYGFRYLEIAGYPGELKADQIEAVVIHSALEETGAFECSNPLVNQLFSNIVWGQRSNFLDVPTDCPQRDERQGWTGDTQVFANVATYNMYCPEFYTKWIHDLNSCQQPDGGYPAFAPDAFRWGLGDFGGFATGWADAAIICPDVLFKKYGDLRIIRKYFDNMKRYLDIQIKAAGGNLIVNNACYGDWLNIEDDTSRPLLSTAYLAGMSRLLAHHAKLLGRKDDEQYLLNQFEAVREAFRKEFFKQDRLTEKSQTAALLTLHFDLAPEKAYKNVCAGLLKNIRDKKVHLSTGFLGTPLLLKVLTKIGEIDLAYELLQQTSYPGWLYPVTQGATTMWERWNSWNEETGFGDIGMNSFNHYAYGAVGEWFYETICGIQPMAETAEQAGFKHFRLAPEFGNSLEYANAAYHSQHGLIASGWRRSEEMILWMFQIPCGTTAEVCLNIPGAESALLHAGLVKSGEKFIAEPGEYQVEIPVKSVIKTKKNKKN